MVRKKNAKPKDASAEDKAAHKNEDADNPTAKIASGGRQEKAKPPTPNENSQATRERKHWLDYFTATFALIAAIAAGVAAGFAGWQAFIAKDTAKRQLRAYVGVEPIDLIGLGVGSKVAVKYASKNMGQTPARNVIYRSKVAVLPFPLPPNTPIHESPNPTITSKTVLFSDIPTDGRSEMDEPLTASELIAITDGSSAQLYVAGIVTYDDVFGEPHRTYFCASTGGSKLRETIQQAQTAGGTATTKNLFTYCSQHNDAD